MEPPTEFCPKIDQATTTKADPWAAGGTATQLGALLAARYEVLEEVGRGGMGVIYRARHRTLDRPVAVKVTLPGAPIDRFLREARLLARIQSPHVVTIHDAEVLADGSPVLVMEWIEGGTLQQAIQAQSGPLPEEQVLPWMRQVCAGMLAAAEHGIVHRDLKPSNILLDTHGQARVADFGLARGPAGQNDLAQTLQELMGTPYYMAPEQAEDPHNLDSRADIYSFGATFYHALTGTTPFTGATAFSVLFKHKTEPLIPPRAHNPLLSEHINELLERCLAKSANDRFQSFRELHVQLEPLHSPVSPWQAFDDDGLAPFLARYQARRNVYLHQRDTLTEPDVYEFPGGRVLRFVAGTIVDQQADALVSSDDGNLNMGGNGVAASLARVAGSAYVAEARRFIPVRTGRAVVTSAGALQARFVFHGITLDGDVQQRVCPSRDLISEILASCFYHADTLHVRSIVFPLLGTGVGGFAQEVCLDTMFRFLARVLLRGLTSVREVRVVLFRPTS